MSNFAFKQIEPESTGFVERMPTPIGDYLSASMGQGWNDSAFNSVMRMTEQTLERWDPDSRTIDPDEANAVYGIRDRLKFDQPIKETEAMLMNRRKRAEMDRQFFLENGSSLGRFLPGIGAGMLGGLTNPLDFSLLFFPILGEEKYARLARMQGQGALRGILKGGGLLSMEDLARSGVPAPRFVGSVIQGVGGQAVFEVPNMLASNMDQADYTAKQFLSNVVASGLFAGGIHAALSSLEGAARIYRNLNRDTKSELIKQKMEEFLTGKDTDVTPLVNVDDQKIRADVRAEYDKYVADRVKSLDMEDVKKFIKDKYSEKVVNAAYLLDDGSMLQGSMHAMISIPEDTLDLIPPHTPADRETIANHPGRHIVDVGFVTDKGRFVSREEAAGMVGQKGQFLSEDLNQLRTFHEGSMSPEEQALHDYVMEQNDQAGGDHKDGLREASKAIRDLRARKADENFFKRPEIQELINREKEARVAQVIEEAKAKFKDRLPEPQQQEIKQQIQAGKTLPKSVVEDSLHGETPSKSDIQQIVKQIEDLKDGEGKESPKPKTSEEISSNQQAIKQALDCILKKIS